jgi:cell division protein FtsX
VIDRFHTAIAAVTVLGSTAFLLALMVIRAEERKETVGILRLIGISRKSILIEVIIEGLLVAIGGAVFGVTIALLAQRGRELDFQALRHGRWCSSASRRPSPSGPSRWPCPSA